MKNKTCLSRQFEQFVQICEFSMRRRPQTIRSYRETFLLFSNLMPEVTKTHHLSTIKVNEFFKRLQTRQRSVGKHTKSGLKDSTIATYWSKLNTFLVYLESNGLIDKNPLASITKPKAHYDNKPALKKQEIEQIYTCILLNSYSTFLLKRDTAMVSILFFTGIRKSELLALHVRDVDLDRNILTIRGATSKSKRTRLIPINPILRIHLKDYLNERRRIKSEYLLVSSTTGNQLTQHGIKKWVVRLRKNSGVYFHLHQFRHTFACNLAKNNISLPNLQRLMGHVDLRMTERYVRSLGVQHLIEDVLKLSVDDSY